jgi:hypothetical protein
VNVHDPLLASSALASCLLYNEGHWCSLIQQTQLAVRVLLVPWVAKDATVQQCPVVCVSVFVCLFVCYSNVLLVSRPGTLRKCSVMCKAHDGAARTSCSNKLQHFTQNVTLLHSADYKAMQHLRTSLLRATGT